MQESSLLTDCLESLKHAAERYQQAALEADSDNVRELLQDIMYDRCEQQAAVFNLMHQMGMYETEPADDRARQRVLQRFEEKAAELERRHLQAHEEGDAPRL